MIQTTKIISCQSDNNKLTKAATKKKKNVLLMRGMMKYIATMLFHPSTGCDQQ
jgi:hypothetical protein